MIHFQQVTLTDQKHFQSNIGRNEVKKASWEMFILNWHISSIDLTSSIPSSSRPVKERSTSSITVFFFKMAFRTRAFELPLPPERNLAHEGCERSDTGVAVFKMFCRSIGHLSLSTWRHASPSMLSWVFLYGYYPPVCPLKAASHHHWMPSLAAILSNYLNSIRWTIFSISGISKNTRWLQHTLFEGQSRRLGRSWSRTCDSFWCICQPFFPMTA